MEKSIPDNHKENTNMNDKKEPVATAAQNQIEAELSKAFHLLCDAFPEPMALCHRSHRVIAVNPAAEKYGRIVGTNCAKGCPGAEGRTVPAGAHGEKGKNDLVSFARWRKRISLDLLLDSRYRTPRLLFPFRHRDHDRLREKPDRGIVSARRGSSLFMPMRMTENGKQP